MNRCEYVRRVLDAYRLTPGTAGVVRRADRLFAAQLYDRGVPLNKVENALILAAARRSARPADAAPLGTIRSLAYFAPVMTSPGSRAVRKCGCMRMPATR